MELTVGYIEEELRKFPKNTVVHLSCGHCHHGASGSEAIIKIADKTNQTYGYLELEVNSNSIPNIECTPYKEEFYVAEIASLNDKIAKLERVIKTYKNCISSISASIKYLE